MFVSHLQCSSCSSEFDAAAVNSVCTRCGKALLVRYNLLAARTSVAKDTFSRRNGSMWKYRELLPVFEERNIVSLGEGSTPLVRLEATGNMLGLSNLWLKDEAANPTGSFKARGMSVAISKAKELGILEVAAPSAGNAGGALAAYAGRAGMRAHVFMPRDTPRANIDEARAFGADVELVDGTIADAAKRMAEMNRNAQWFDCSTLKEPYRLEGKKTMGFEIAEQFREGLPDVIVYPTGGGTGLIGMWKAFDELEQLGWISSKRPQMVVVQSSGCAPIVRAFGKHEAVSTQWDNAKTIASGLRVPKAFADHLILKVLYESGGAAVAVDDDAIVQDMKHLALVEGLFVCPEGAATLSGLRRLVERGLVGQDNSILLLNTGSGYKYAELFSSTR